MKSETVFKVFLKGDRVRLLEFISVLYIGLIGNLLVTKADLYLALSFYFYRYIEWGLTVQLILLILVAIRFFDLAQKLNNFKSSAIDSFKESDVKKTIDEYMIDSLKNYKVIDSILGNKEYTVDEENIDSRNNNERHVLLQKRVFCDLIFFSISSIIVLLISYIN